MSLKKRKHHDKYSINNTDYEIGQDNVQKWGFDVHNAVFGISAGLILLFVILALVADPKVALSTLNGLKTSIINNFDSFFMWAGNIFVVTCLVLIILPQGKIRLGGKDAKPDHSRLSWFSMLFAAGMGIGLMFWSVAEPVGYYTNWFGTPLNVTPFTKDAADLALGATMYHWGLHPWAAYGVVALSLAFFAYNKGLPLSIRSVFYPMLGERTWGWIGNVIDILAVVATLFGLATSLGFGAQQAAGGLHHIFGLPNTVGLQVSVIIAVTCVALYSVIKGIDGGVKLLSNINMGIAVALLVFVAAINIGVVLDAIPTTLVSYISHIIPLSNPYGRVDETWFHDWTVFYWAWWFSWSPFVGMFIARVSRGRTIREFLLAVLIVPTLVTLVWMSTFGGIGIHQAVDKIGILGTKGITDYSLALFQMFEALPFSSILSFIGITLVLVFFVTSSDSGSLVIDSITAGGKLDAPVAQRIFWAVLQGAVAAVLIWIGGTESIKALQAGAVSTGLPFTVIMLLMIVNLILGLRTERY